MEKIRALNRIAEARGQMLAKMALSRVYSHEGITSVLIGASKPEQITENLKMVQNLHFTQEEFDAIDQASLQTKSR